MEKNKITYMATYEVQDLSKPVWVTVDGRFNCDTIEEAIDAATVAAADDPQATGSWSVSMHHQGKRYCYSRQVADGHIAPFDMVDIAI